MVTSSLANILTIPSNDSSALKGTIRFRETSKQVFKISISTHQLSNGTS